MDFLEISRFVMLILAIVFQISNGQINFCTDAKDTVLYPNDYELVFILPCDHDTVQNVACDFDFGDGNITKYKWDIVTVLSTLKVTHRYLHLGRYDIKVTCSPAFSGRYSVLMDNPITKLCSDPPPITFYPPAAYPMNIWTPLNHIPVFNMSCMYDMGDDIDRLKYNKTHSSVLLTENALFDYKYLTLGPHNISVRCATFNSSLTVNNSVYVENVCFSTNGIFYRQYSQISSPLVLSTAVQYEASSRLNVYCSSAIPEYQWTMENQVEGVFQKFNLDFLATIYRDLILPENSVRPGFYRITCRVTFNESIDVYFQESTYVRFVAPPYLNSSSKIRCIRNCLIKVSVMHPLHLEFTEESSSYSWDLRVEDSSGSYVSVTNLIKITYYGTENKDCIIKEGSLTAKKNYKISVATLESVEVYYFSTNSPPAPGNCSTLPSFGYTFDVMHYVVCRSDWYDEDSYLGLYYLYLDQTSPDVSDLQVLYFGGESSSPLIPLPVGKVNGSFGSKVRVRVYDIYGDYTETINEVVSEPRLKGSNLTSLTAEQVTSLLENFKTNLINNNLTMAGRSGDYSKAVQVIESGASIYNNLKLPNTGFSLSVHELSAAGFRANKNGQLEAFSWGDFWTDYLNAEDSAQKGKLQEIGENLGHYSAELCGTMLQVRSNLSSYFISQFLTSMTKIISNPDYVMNITLENVLQCALNLTNSLVNLAENIYIGGRMQSMENITLASTSVVHFVANVLRALRPTLTPHLPINPEVETMRAYVQYTELFFTKDQVQTKRLSLQERTFIAMAELKKVQIIQDMKSQWARSLMPSVEEICMCLATALRTFSGTMHNSSVNSDRLAVMSYEVWYNDLVEGVFVNVDGVPFGLKGNSPLDLSSKHVIEFSLVVYKENPYFWDDVGETISSQVLQINITGNPTNVPLKNNINVILENKNNTPCKGSTYVMPVYSGGDNSSGSFLYYKFNRKSRMDDVFVFIKSKSSRVEYDILLRNDVRPTHDSYDYFTTTGPSNWTKEDGFKVYIPAGVLQRDYAVVYIGFLPRIVDQPKNRDQDAPGMDPLYADVCMRVSGVQCMVRLDETWKNSICKVDPKSSKMESTTCICNSVTLKNMYIGTTFDIPQALYEHDVITVVEFKSGFAYVYATLGLVTLIFGIIMFLTWKNTAKELNWRRCNFLVDNDVADAYFYIITVYTGFGSEAGTDSNVFFELYGDEDTSGIRLLKDECHRPLYSGTVLQYVMSVRAPVGDLLTLRIWHDNSGGKNWSWYLKRIIIDDPQIHKRYEFNCEKWFAVDKTDRQILRSLTPTIQSKFYSLTHILFMNMSQFFLYRYMWLSLCIRMHPGSFLRYKRFFLGLIFLLTLMFLNAMLVEYNEAFDNESHLSVEPFKFSLSTLYTALGSVAITVPIFYTLSSLFDNSEPITNKFVFSDNLKKRIPTSLRLKDKSIYERNVSANDSFLTPGGCISCKWRIVSWIILAVIFFICLPYLITVASIWDVGKAKIWLSCLLVSILLSAVIVEPMVVIIASIIYTFVTRQIYYLPEPKVALEKLKTDNRLVSAFAIHKRGPLSRKVTPEALAPDRRRLSKLRRLTLLRPKSGHVIINLLFYITFFCIVYNIALATRDERSFMYNDQLEKRLDFREKVKTREDLTKWLNTTFFDNYFPSKIFNVRPISSDLMYFFADLNSVRVGPARLRQVRIVPEECRLRMFEIDLCHGPYSSTNEDKRDYFIGWKTEHNQSKRKEFTTEAWVYIPVEENWGLPVFGEYIYQYGGGGYFIKLDVNKDVSIEILKELVEFSWIDLNTRAVFLEFSLYNPNINVFLYITYLAELTEVGAVVTSSYVQAFRLYYSGLGITFCYLIFTSLVVMSILKAFYGVFMEGTYYLFSPLNVTDLFGQILGVAGVFLIFYRHQMTTTTISVFLRDKNAYVNFEHLALANFTLLVILGGLIFYLSVRIMLEQYDNKWFRNTIMILKKSGDDLRGFMIVFAIVYCGYAITGHLLFGRDLLKYRTLYETMGTLAESLIGKNQLDPLLKTSPGLAEFYYCTYVIFVILTMMNVATSMLNAGIEQVASLDKREKNRPVGLKTKFLNLMRNIQNTVQKSLQKLFARKTRKITGLDDIVEESRNKTTDHLQLYDILVELRTIMRGVNEVGFK